MKDYPKKKNIFFFRVYDICNYKFKNKLKKSKKISKKLKISKIVYWNDYLKKYIGIVIIFHFHNFPHILLIRNKHKNSIFCFPGGKINTLNESSTVLQYLLKKKLSLKYKKITSFVNIGKWIFPEIENRIKYPYFPPHLKLKKNELHLYLVEIKNLSNFQINIKWDIIAVPLFEINDNVFKYGSVVSKLPTLLIPILSNFNKIVI